MTPIEGHSGLLLIEADDGHTRFECMDDMVQIQAFYRQGWMSPQTSNTWIGGPCAMRRGSGRGVSAGYQGELDFWDLENCQEVRVIQGHSSWVRALAVSVDAQTAVSGSEDQTMKAWDMQSGRWLQVMKGHSGAVLAVDVSADGRWAVSGSADQTLKVWDLNNGQELQTLEGHSGSVFAVAMSADARWVVSGGEDRTLKVWDLRNEPKFQRVGRHAASVHALALNSDGRLALTGASDGTLRLWNIESRQILLDLEGHGSAVSAVAMSADGRRAVSAAYDDTLKLWNLENGKELRVLQGHLNQRGDKQPVQANMRRTFKEARVGADFNNWQWTAVAHEGAAWVEAVVVSGDGRRAMSFSTDRAIKHWDLESGQALRTLPGDSGPDPLVVTASKDGRRAVCTTSCGRMIKEWDLESGEQLLSSECVHLDYHGERDARILGFDGRRAVCMAGSMTGTLEVWDLRSSRTLSRLSRIFIGAPIHADVARVDEGFKSGFGFSADGKWVVSGGTDQMVKVWDVTTGEHLCTFTGDSALLCSAFTSTGRTIVVGEQSGRTHFLRLVLPDDPLIKSEPDPR